MNFAWQFSCIVTDRYANEIDIVLIAFQKNGKNTRGRLELLTSIYCFHNGDIPMYHKEFTPAY